MRGNAHGLPSGLARLRALLLALILGVGAFFCEAQIAFQQYPFGFTGVTGGESRGRLLSGPDGTLYGTTYLGGRYGRGTVFKIMEDGSEFALLYDFKPTGGDGAFPYSELVFGRDGALYGTTSGGGTNNGAGTMFKIETDGTGYRVLFHFYSNGGYGPRGHLQEGDDGAFYGTTQYGGAGGGGGTVYKINQDGTGFRVLHPLLSRPDDGSNPDTGLTLGSDGMLYGTATLDGLYGGGTLFKISQDGDGYTNLHQFRGPAQQDGKEPDGRPLELADGTLYGTTGGSGLAPPGTVYRINKDGTGYRVLRIFNTTNGEPGAVTSELIQGSDGALYSTSGTTVFKILPDGSGLQVLHRFTEDGFYLRGLVMGTSGALFGTASYSAGPGNAGTLYRINQDGTGFAVLLRFKASTNHLQLPRAPLIRGSDGLFYGTTELGGSSSNAGTLFSFRTNNGKIRVVFAFGEGTNNARNPNGILEASDGHFYGTTLGGGVLNGGAIFRISRDGSGYGILRQLGATGEPRNPRCALIEGVDGWLYGTTFSGGANNRGTVFKIQKDTGELIIVHAFGPTTAGGVSPQGDLVQAADGALYGTTSAGGVNNLGTIFRLYPDGSGYTNLHHFTGGAAGQNPQAGLMLGSDQKLYGTTARVFGGYAGTVFSISMDGTGYQVLRAFPNTGLEPKSPRPVVEGLDGVLYGSTLSGGTFSKGTLFRINKDGSDFQILRHFGGSSGDGQTPSASFTVVGDGSFLGVTEAGGDGGNGTVFRFDPEETRLRIVRSGAQAELSWNRSSTADTLEATINLSASDWQPYEGAISEQAEEYHAEIPFDSPAEFFRVHREWK